MRLSRQRSANRRRPFLPAILLLIATLLSMVMGELLPRVLSLAALARRYGIGLNMDAEEADRLDLSLDILEALCSAPKLAGWDGIGFVVQAYGKRAFFVLDWLVDLARAIAR